MTAIDNPTRGLIAEDAAQRVRAFVETADSEHTEMLTDYLRHGTVIGELELHLLFEVLCTAIADLQQRVAELEQRVG